MQVLTALFSYFKSHRLVAHLAFWLAILLFSIGRNDLGAGEWAFTPSVIYALALLMTQIPATYFLGYVGLALLLNSKNYVSSLGLLVGVAYVISVLSRIVIVYLAEPTLAALDTTFQAPEQDSLYTIATDLYKLFHVYVFNNFSVAFIFLVIKLLLMQHASQQQAITLEKEKVSSELQHLKSQLNPHFLFNTLNNIYSLAVIGSPKTADSIGRLSGILDYVLYRAPLSFVPVREELDIIDNYINLEKLRYSERLTITFENKVQSDVQIVPLLLVSLVENAFKHGASTDIGFPEIHIQTATTDNKFIFAIKNTIVAKAEIDGRVKIGLLNISKQLELVYGNKHCLEVASGEKYFFSETYHPAMKISCLLVDDEPLALDLLANHLQKFEKFEVVARCANAVEALQILSERTIDLMFLDIHMGGISGIDFLKSLKSPPKTILTTAYREFALEGYELDLVDYLLKPIRFERFFKAIERYLRQYGQRTTVTAAVAQASEVLLKAGTKHYKLDTTSILYIESVRDCIKIYEPENYTLVKYKISELEKALSRQGFVRIHRSFIVNIKKVTAFSANRIVIGEKELPVGTNYKPFVTALMSKDVQVVLSENRAIAPNA